MEDVHSLMKEAAPPPGQPVVVGWREYVAFPDWDLRRVKVKMDTGARTSALDVVQYFLRPGADGGWVAELHLAVEKRRSGQVKVVHTPVLDMVGVRNTGGVCERRPVVEAAVRLGPVTKRVRLTVTNRSHMRFRMILGRKALEGDFLVDVSKQYLCGRCK